MITYIQGDVFTSSANIIAHGCNCRGGFGAGIAVQVAKLYPKAKDMYMKKFFGEGWRVGEVQMVPVGNNKFIANCATQDKYGSPKGGKVYVSYPGLKAVMEQLKEICEENDYTLAMPKIGSELAGGDWNVIEKIINDVFGDREVFVYIYNGKKA